LAQGFVGALAVTPVTEVGTVDHILVPTDGLWRGVMNSLDQPSLMNSFSGRLVGNPFFQTSGLTAAYLSWTAVWVFAVLLATHYRFSRLEP
jgi:hypothetical protein